MTRTLRAVVAAASAVVAAVAVTAAPVSAQTTNFTPSTPVSSEPHAGGWTLTPALAAATTWDGNVLMKTTIDEPVGANVNALNPRLSADYLGRRTQVNGSYDGSFLMYRGYSALDSYDQRGAVFLRRTISKHLSIFANDSIAFTPTTELVAFVGVPFVRTGSRINDAHGGITLQADRRTSVTVSYNFEWVSFDTTPEFANVLRGGHSQGVTLGAKRDLTAKLAATVDYDLQRATVTERVAGNPIGDFTIHTAWAGAEAKLSPALHAYGAFGFSRVGVSAFGPPTTGPAWRGGFTYQRRRTGVDVGYTRSFVPSYSFGGTMQNEDLTARLRRTITRRMGAQGAASWRSNQSLLPGEPDLVSLWLEGTLGYAAQPWLRLEGFYVFSRQTIERPGGTLDRTRIGFQVVTSNPIRVR